MKNLGFLVAAPFLVAVALWQLQCTAAFMHPAIPSTLNIVHSMTKYTSSRAVFARRHRLAVAPRMAGNSGIKVKNAALIGDVIPSNWVESKDFVRDGRNLKVGDLVLVGRSDGRFVLRFHTIRAILTAVSFSTRFAEIIRSAGFGFQNQWEVAVTVDQSGNAGASKVEEGINLAKPVPAALQAVVRGGGAASPVVVRGISSVKPPPPPPPQRAPPPPPPARVAPPTQKVAAPVFSTQRVPQAPPKAPVFSTQRVQVQ